jgi:hypothetical protein
MRSQERPAGKPGMSASWSGCYCANTFATCHRNDARMPKDAAHLTPRDRQILRGVKLGCGLLLWPFLLVGIVAAVGLSYRWLCEGWDNEPDNPAEMIEKRLREERNAALANTSLGYSTQTVSELPVFTNTSLSYGSERMLELPLGR